MQSIPDGNLGEIERSKAEMEAFRKRRKSARKRKRESSLLSNAPSVNR